MTNEHSTVIHNIHTGGSTIRCNLDIGEQDFKMNSCCVFGGLANHLLLALDGLDDKVVPPNQAEAMVAVLREKGTPVAYCPFEGEGHGFRQAVNMKRALDGELYFYGRIFGFTPADAIEPVAIENLAER